MAHDAGPQRPTLGDLAALVERRLETIPHDGEVGLSLREVSRRSGLSAQTWARVRKGQDVQSLTYSAVESALRWPPRSIRTYLDGGPAPVDLPEPAPVEPARGAPTIYEAEFDELLGELRRRYLVMLERGTDRLRVADSPERGGETASSVEGRGMVPGLPLPADTQNDDVAEGDQS